MDSPDDVKKDITEQLIKLDITDLLNCLESNAKTKKSFEKFVRETNDERRNKSTIIRMRKFHNWVKDVLINTLVNFVPNRKEVYLLDIAVGRGGDLNKWFKANIKGVFGFDANYDSINSNDPFNPGAKQRLLNYHSKDKLKSNIKFEVGNALEPNLLLLDSIDAYLLSNKIKGFQIVSCQFALHYFFEHRQNLMNVLKLVSGYLVKGGYFIGTAINGDKIRKLMNYKRLHSDTLFTIRNEKAFSKNHYGNRYTFVINDSGDVGNYFNTTGISTEYLVDFQQLVELCAQVNLVPVTENYFETYLDQDGNLQFAKTSSILDKTKKLSNVYDFTDIIRKWRQIKPGEEPLNNDELRLNDLYSAFVFKKV